jgi:hypothetical protein
VPVALGSLAGLDPVERGGHLGEPGLAGAQPHDLASHLAGGFQADGAVLGVISTSLLTRSGWPAANWTATLVPAEWPSRSARSRPT